MGEASGQQHVHGFGNMHSLTTRSNQLRPSTVLRYNEIGNDNEPVNNVATDYDADDDEDDGSGDKDDVADDDGDVVEERHNN